MTVTVEQKQEKQNVIASYARGAGDTGSPEVQVALLTGRIASLAQHLETHRKDLHSRTGLLKMLGQRRRLLNYLRVENGDRYRGLIGRLGLRR